jgi:hypothetical protein
MAVLLRGDLDASRLRSLAKKNEGWSAGSAPASALAAI